MQDVTIQLWDDHFMLTRVVPGYQIDLMTEDGIEMILRTMHETVLATDFRPTTGEGVW